MEAVKYLQKDRSSALKYSYVSHDKVTAALRQPLIDNGVYYSVSIVDCKHEMSNDRNGNPVIFTTVNALVTFTDVDSGEEINVYSYGTGIDPSDKGVGKAVSYAVKYALLKTFGLETGDDPEDDQIEIGKNEPSGQQAGKANHPASPSPSFEAAKSTGFIEGRQQKYIWAWATSPAPSGLGLQRSEVDNALIALGFVDSTGKAKISIVPTNRFEDLKNYLTLRASA